MRFRLLPLVCCLLAAAANGYLLPPTRPTSTNLLTSSASFATRTSKYLRATPNSDEAEESSGEANEEIVVDRVTATTTDLEEKRASKREMLGFALPALGIYLANPLLSNIDNSFVGKTVGTEGLAALSPATICTDQMLYLFSFLSRATTGLVSRAYGSKQNDEEKKEAAATAASAPLTVSLVSGLLLSIFYALFTPRLLGALNVTPALRESAGAYVLIRGAIAWAALAQSVSLSIMMATRDAITPLKIVGLAAGVNVIGDFLLCVWPFRWGVSGAAAATSFSTLFSSFFMIKALRKKSIAPKIRLPTRKELLGLTEFTGPLLAITVTRLIGFVNMQRTAMTLGVKHLAAYQMSINLVIFFLLFAEPLSQLSQTQLPALVDAEDGQAVKANLKSVLTLGAFTALGVGGIAGLALGFGSPLFTSDLAVQALAKEAAPSVFITVATAIFAVTVDGAMLASRDFGFMLGQGTLTMLLQLFLLKSAWCSSISAIFTTFTIRLGSYAISSVARAAFGYGKLGKVIKKGDLMRGATVNGLSKSKTRPVEA
mmetsp:Transcript_15521/g.44823  ORF Transcript_15521/g.44823 Transcript_15521/m.44823 type:complete len:543 (-) Transcript_15521:380-2008(-)